MDPFGEEVKMYIKVEEFLKAFKNNAVLWHIAGQAVTDMINKLPKYDLKQTASKKVKK